MIYFDNAATTQMSDAAIKALIDVSKNYYGNASAIYSYGRKSKDIINESREIIADAIGAKKSEIFFTSCGTESDNLAIMQVEQTGVDSIISSKIEHHAILNPIASFKEREIRTVLVDVEKNGVIDLKQLKMALNGNKQLVSVMYQNNETGIIQPVKKIAELVHDSNSNSIFHTDAVQAIGHTHINVKELGIDMLSASAHKFNGPKGVGFIYIREELSVVPMMRGGGQEQTLRSGTENVAGIYSMAKALEKNVANLDVNSCKIKNLEERLLEHFCDKNISYVINGDRDYKAPGVLSISFMGIDGEGLLNSLDVQGICVSIGSACNSEVKERSYVLKAMGFDDDRIDSSIRISIGVNNTEKEIDILAMAICKYVNIVQKLKTM